MTSLKRMLTGAVSSILSCFTLIWIIIDHLFTVKNLNEKRLQELRSDEREMGGKIVKVTGSNSGIGFRTSLELARRGAKVVMACRDQRKAEAARNDILEVIPDADLELMSINLGDLQSIRKFVDEFKSRHDHLDVLVNNAGIFTLDTAFTNQGFEKHIGVNYLGSFLLTLLLLESLIKAEDGRIIFLSSSLISLAILNLDNIMMKDQQLGLFTPYANSKLCLAIFSKQLANFLSGTRVTTYALCTGLVRTNLVRKKGRIFHDLLIDGIHKIGAVSIEQGCATVLHCVLSRSLERETGQFYRYLTTWKPADRMIDRYCGKKLWKLSQNLVGLKRFRLDFINRETKGEAS